MVFSKSFPAWWPVDTVTPRRLDGLHGLQALKALIAARNRILSLDGISPKKNPLLETVVLSHNRLETVSLAGKGGGSTQAFGEGELPSGLCCPLCRFQAPEEAVFGEQQASCFPTFAEAPCIGWAATEWESDYNHTQSGNSLEGFDRLQESLILKCIAVRVLYWLALICKTFRILKWGDDITAPDYTWRGEESNQPIFRLWDAQRSDGVLECTRTDAIPTFLSFCIHK